jgi:small multidrug resistance pump
MRWFLLGSAIVAEVAATSSMRAATMKSGSPWWWTAVAVGYVLSFALFAGALARGAQLGASYATWAGIGVALTAAVAYLVFHERITPWMLAGIALIVAGVVVVELAGHPSATP